VIEQTPNNNYTDSPKIRL